MFLCWLSFYSFIKLLHIENIINKYTKALFYALVVFLKE